MQKAAFLGPSSAKGATLRSVGLGQGPVSLMSPPVLPVLVVEDEPMIARALERQLKAAGLRATCVASVSEAASLEGDFCAAVIDLNLPDGSGITVADDLYARAQVDHLFFFSATLDEQEIAEAKKRGLFIAKSDGVEFVVSAVGRVIRRAEGSAPPQSHTRPSAPYIDLEELTPTWSEKK